MNIKKIIKEELEWIKKIEPKYMPKKDELIEVRYENKDSFLQWIGSFKTPYLSGKFGKYIKGRVVDISDNFFLLVVKDTTGNHGIYFPTITDNIEWTKPYWPTSGVGGPPKGIYVEDIGLRYVPLSS